MFRRVDCNMQDFNLDDVDEDEDAVKRFKRNLNDFFKNEYAQVALELVEVCGSVAGPETGKKELVDIFAVSQKGKKGHLQKKLIECVQSPPNDSSSVDAFITELSVIENEILDLTGELIYAIDEWLAYYRDRAEKNIPIPMMQVYAVNAVVEDFQRLDKYLKKEHQVLFGSILNIFEQLKRSF